MEQQLPVATIAVATQDGPVHVVIHRENNEKEKQFVKEISKYLSGFQIFLGIVSIFCRIGIIIDYCNYSYPSPSSDRCITTDERTYCGYIYTGEKGIYCGIVFISAGIIGLEANSKSTISNIIAFLLASILACLFAAAQFIIGYLNAFLVTQWSSPNPILILVFLLLANTAVVEGIAAILSCFLCCVACLLQWCRRL
jgi:hypothetical protein